MSFTERVVMSTPMSCCSPGATGGGAVIVTAGQPGCRCTPQRSPLFVALVLGSVFVLGGIGRAPASHAAITFTVTRFDDPGLPDPGPGVCQPGNCSLRQAVIAANMTPGADTIRVPAGLCPLKRFTSADELEITDDVTITKSGAGSAVIVDASGAATHMRAFDIFAHVTLVNIGVQYGQQLGESLPMGAAWRRAAGFGCGRGRAPP
jgi:hypothetical protein